MNSSQKNDFNMLLSVQQVAEMLGISVRQVWRMKESGSFPQPIGISTKIKRWPRNVVIEWIDAQTAITVEGGNHAS